MAGVSTVLSDAHQHKLAGEAHFAASQLLMLFDAVILRPSGTFLELGTDRGQATNVILDACARTGGQLVSVDVRDCSSAAAGPHWTFVRASSVDRAAILAAAPVLSGGIDMIYVDSLHTAAHVEQEVYTWFDLVREGGRIYFDDVDSGPYLAGARKDNARMEIANRRIRELIERIFYANLDRLDLSFAMGSTGLACLTKRSGLGDRLQPCPKGQIKRHSDLLARLMSRVRGKTYSHLGDGSDFIWTAPQEERI